MSKSKTVLVKRDGAYLAVPFTAVKAGDVVFFDGIVNNNNAICSGDAHYSGDASYDGYLFYTEGDSVFPEDVEAANLNERMTIWCRVGCTLPITMKDALVLFGDDENAAATLLAKLIRKNRLVPDGDSYIPASQVDDFNNAHGTMFTSVEVGTCV